MFGARREAVSQDRGEARPSEVLTSPMEAAGIVDDWRALAHEVGCGYFSLPDWVLAWWEVYGQDSQAELAVWRDEAGQLGAVVGLVRFDQRLHPRLPLRVSAWANLASRPGSADHYAWPCRPESSVSVRSWLASRAAEAPMVLTNLDAEQAVPLLPGGRCIGLSRCPRLTIPAEGEELPSSTRFRQRLRAATRKVLNDGVTFRWIRPGDVTDELLERLLDLHERRRDLVGGSTTFDRTRGPLLHRLAQTAGPGRGPAAVVAEHDGRVVGMIYGFVWQHDFAYYQGGWEPEWASRSLGTVLVAEGIALAGREGLRVWDFLRGAGDYKYRFGAQDRVDQTWLIGRGLSGRILDVRFGLKARLAGAQHRQEVAGSRSAQEDAG